MKRFDCERFVIWGFFAGLLAWAIFIAILVYAAIYVPDAPAHLNQLFTERRGFQAFGFITGWWISIAGLTLCVVGYFREFRGLNCLLGVVPAAAYVANPWSVMVFVKFIGS